MARKMKHRGDSKQRLFIAIYPPAKLTAKAFEEIKQIPYSKRRLIDKQQAHLTLSFLGNVESHELDKLKQRLQFICDSSRPFSIKTAAYSYLPPNGLPRLLVLCCHLGPELAMLRNQCEQIKSHQENKQFIPHITLCRFKQKNFKKVIPEHKKFEFKVTHVKLMRSELSSASVQHKCLYRVNLN